MTVEAGHCFASPGGADRGHRHVYIELAQGFHVRDLVETGVCSRIRDGSGEGVVVLSPGAHDRGFVQYVGECGGNAVPLTFFDSEGLTGPARQVLRWVASQHPQHETKTKWRFIGAWLRRRGYYRELLSDYPPRALVIPRGGHLLRGEPLCAEHVLFAATRPLNVPVVLAMSSWDQAFKPIVIRPTSVAVWSEWMKSALLRHHTWLDESEIAVTGAPQLDVYFATRRSPRGEFLSSIGLDADRPVVLVGTCGLGLDETFIVRDLLRARDAGELPRGLQVLVRPHPFDSPLPFASLADIEGVVIDTSGRRYPGLGWTPSSADMAHGADMVCHSDVMVNIATTLTLEAAIVRTPAVVVGYCPTTPELFHRTVEQITFRSHFRELIARQLVHVARDAHELVAAVRNKLHDPSLDEKVQASIVSEYIEFIDGRSAQRLADHVLQVAR